MAYYFYLAFIISYFLHVAQRVPALGAARVDLILTGVVLCALLLRRSRRRQPDVGRTGIILTVLAAYVILSLPLVRWPGSVLNTGIPNFIKAVVFYYYTVALVDTQPKLRGFVAVFVACQLFRVLEPYYLHLAFGYWGSNTYMAGEVLDRLSGSPHDVINPNGLAFVINSVLPFLHYLSSNSSMIYRLSYWLALPVLLHALILSASRTGILAIGATLVGIFLKSRRKLRLMLITLSITAIALASLDDLQRDRYLSIWRSDVRGSATARGRTEGVLRNFEVGMRQPVFGHGLGTSLEANANSSQRAQPAHNLYAEVFEELGGIGLILYLIFIGAIISNFRHARRLLRRVSDQHPYLVKAVSAMEIWLLMNILFSFASYGLSSYEWYLFAGLSVVVRRLALEGLSELPSQSNLARFPGSPRGGTPTG